MCAMGLRGEMSRSAVAMGFIVKFADNNDVYSSKDVHELEGKEEMLCAKRTKRIYDRVEEREKKKKHRQTQTFHL